MVRQTEDARLKERFFLVCLPAHFFLIVAVSCRATFSVLGLGLTWLPPSLKPQWETAEHMANAALGQTLPYSNPLRQSVPAYLHAVGTEGGYGFFAPGVPSSYKLVFEVRSADGRVEYELPHFGGTAAGVRFLTLLDYIGRTDYDPLRQVMMKMLAYSVWQKHPDATLIRAVLGYVQEPTMTEAKAGKKESYKFLYAYDFRFSKPAASPAP
jgi:hypothetical protein